MKNVLVVTQWGYEEGLIQSYTLPYLKMMHQYSPCSKIYLITQEKAGLERNRDKLDAIQKSLAEFSIYLVPEKYQPLSTSKYFGVLLNALKHIGLVIRKRIKCIHTFCTPSGGYGYLLAKLTGCDLIVDSYEPHSEYMREGKVWNEKSAAYKLVRLLEKKQATAAKYLIATTPAMIEYSNKRFNINIKNAFVKPACVDLEKFSFRPQARERIRRQIKVEDKIVCVYAGKFGGYYLKDEVFAFLRAAFDFWGDRFHFLLLSDLDPLDLTQLADHYSLKIESITHLTVAFEEVPDYLSAADFAISAYRPAFSKRFCTPIKNGEYWAVGLPVVITKNISVDSEIIETNQTGYVLQDLTEREYKNAVQKISQLLQGSRLMLRERIRETAVQHRSYAIAERIYKSIYADNIK